MDKIKVAIVGCGSHARAHAMMVRRSEFAELTACSDIHAEQARRFAEQFGIPASYGDAGEMFRRHAIDLLYIVAFPTVHPQLIASALSMNVNHIICEKPLAMSGTEAQDVLNMARENQALVMEGLMYRHHPQFAKVQSLIEQGVIGQPKTIFAQFSAVPVAHPDNWRNRSNLGGGSLTAKGCYLIDACNVFSQSRAMRAFAYETVDPDLRVEVGFTGTLIYENGVTAQLESNHRSVGREIIGIYGTKGSITIPYAIAANDLTRYIEVQLDGSKEVVQYHFQPANGYYLQLENAYRCIVEGAAPIVPLEETVVNYKVTDALKQSTQTGRLTEVCWT